MYKCSREEALSRNSYRVNLWRQCTL